MTERDTKMLVPKLRFPEFQDAEGWSSKRIGEVTQVTAGATPSTENPEYWNGDIPWMNSGELNQKRVYGVSNRITLLGLKESSTKLVPPGSVLIGLAGQGKTRGTAAINYMELCTNQSIASIIPNKQKFVSEFLFHKIDSMYNNLRSLSKGEGGRGGLNLEIIKSVEIPFPILQEQQKIADCLSSIDELITAQTKKIVALKDHKKGLMEQLFPLGGETVPKLRFSEFHGAGEWVDRSLEQLATYTKGYAFKSEDYMAEGVRIIRVSDLGADHIKSNNEKIYIASESVSDYGRYKLNKGEIIVTTVGSKPELVDSAVGRGIFISFSNEGLLNQNLLKLKVRNEVNSRFLFSNINTSKYQKFIASISRGNANQANIAVKDLMGFKLQIPTLDEQNKIADCLSSIDELITTGTQKLEALKAHKKGLIQLLFPNSDGVKQ
ncbi:MAG TPA: restriction endonuclease subunit S [Methylotenera sp.]|nr:restriction endonuclease subunit S [Methylotenera sp.]